MKKTLLALLLLAATPLFAQRVGALNSFASDFQTVPVMGNVPGAGATFQTFVAIMNPTSTAFPVEVTLYDHNGTRRTATIQLGAGELKTYTNFLDQLFDKYVGGGAVTFRSSDPGRRFIVNAEVWTSGARYGTSIPSLEFAGSATRSFAAGISVDATSRTNIGCFNQSAAINNVRATVFSASGAMAGTVDLTLGPNAWAQTAVNSTVTNGYVQFDPQEAAVCYAVVVTNATNDGRFVLSTEYRP